MSETIDPLAQSEEQQAIALRYTKETANGGQPSPELVTLLNSAGLRQRTEKLRAFQIVAGHNIPAIEAADQARQFLASIGYPESSVAPYVLHPVLFRVQSYDDGFGGTGWTWGIDDKPYAGKAS